MHQVFCFGQFFFLHWIWWIWSNFNRYCVIPFLTWLIQLLLKQSNLIYSCCLEAGVCVMTFSIQSLVCVSVNFEILKGNKLYLLKKLFWSSTNSKLCKSYLRKLHAPFNKLISHLCCRHKRDTNMVPNRTTGEMHSFLAKITFFNIL